MPAVSRKSASPGTQADARSSGGVGIIHAYCAVYTSTRVAGAILDRLGWNADVDLAERSLLEPAAGDGAFLLPAIDRLLASAKVAGFLSEKGLHERLLAFEFDPGTSTALRARVAKKLTGAGLGNAVANRLATNWVRCEDFLTTKVERRFSDIVGNPPYMRWSKLPTDLRKAYETSALPSYAAKGDLCLSFICKSVELLHETKGQLAFLCADRWLRCAYGEEARAVLRTKVRVADHVEAHGLPVFDGARKVSTYAAVTVLDRRVEEGSQVHTPRTLEQLQAVLRERRAKPRTVGRGAILRESGGAFIGEPMLQKVLAATLGLPDFREAGVEIRCGMAIGCADVFVLQAGDDIEPDRLVSFVRSQDLREDGKTSPSRVLVNPWADDGQLVDLRRYPKLGRHLHEHRRALEDRACVTGKGDWYRTIDRLHADRGTDRIFVAGMARRSRVAAAAEGEQPGNALYVLRSSQWPTEALFALLRSGLLDLYAAGLSPTFSGASRRFDGNVLRQVRIPLWSKMDVSLKEAVGEIDVSVPAARPELLCDVLGLRGVQLRKAVRETLEVVWGPVE